jgi:hypothetical protein
MSDVLQTAYEYRQKLRAELAKVEGFLRFGVELSKRGGAESDAQLTSATAKLTPSEDRTAEPPRPAINRAAANESLTASTPERSERRLQFRGAFEPCEIEHIKNVA